MRSNTLMPLRQFVGWWGINPWYVAGIDYENASFTDATALRKSQTDQCLCMLQHPWNSGNNWSRDDFIRMIELAEIMFLNEAGFYPAPHYIEEETKKYPVKSSLGYSVLQETGKPKTIKPDHPCYLQGFGAYSLELVDTVTLDRGVPDVADEFTATVVVPAGTEASDLRVYFTAADGGYTGTPEYNDHLFEIRPLEIVVNGVNATITGSAYLFKQPALDEELQCVEHDYDTYVEDVEVYLVVADECSQGNFICFVDNCQYVPCEPNRYAVCITQKTVGKQKWAMPYPAECDEESNYTTYCLSCIPDEIEYNYLNGVPLLVGNAMQDKYVNVLSMLAVGLADCIKAWCDCLNCPDEKVKYYRQTPSAIITVDRDETQYDVTWQVVLSKASTIMLAGLPPYNGILQALRYINTERCISTEGATYV